MLPTILYNLLMVPVVVLSLLALRRLQTTWAWLMGCLLTGLAAVALAVLVAVPAGWSSFGIFRLVAFGLWGHGLLVLIVSVVLLRRERPKTALASALAALLGAAVAVDAFWIEPTWLEVTRVEVATEKLDEPVRVVLLADLQTDRIGSYEQRVLERCLREEPDLILLAGDYFQAEPLERVQLADELGALLRQIDFDTPAGVFAVRGNVDGDDWAASFTGLPITSVESTQSFDAAGLRLTCLSERASFSRGLELPSDDPERFHLVVGHSPAFALGRVEADLLVAGHTHGGQVRLPFVGPLVTPSRLPGRHSAGMLDLPDGGLLYVSRGVGMERGNAPRLRLFCRPELTVIELVPAP